MERRVLRRAAEEALVMSMGRRPADGTADGRGAADQDFHYRWFDSDDAVGSYDHEPVTEPTPVADLYDPAPHQAPVDSVAVPSESVHLYDLVPDRPADSVPPGDDHEVDEVSVLPEPVEVPPQRPLGASGIAESIVATPVPGYQPQPWYRTKQTATVLAAVAVAAVMYGTWLAVHSPSTAADRSTTETPTAEPAPASAAPPASNIVRPVPPPPAPPPPPPPPPTAEPTYSRPQQQYTEPRRTGPTQAEKPEIGVTRTPATRAPISVAPVPRPVEGSDSNTPGDAPKQVQRRRGCFGFC